VPYALRLVEDTLAPGVRYAPPLGSAAGVLYLADGEMRAEGSAAAPSASGSAPIARPGTIAGPQGARLLRFELVRGPAPAPEGRVLLEHAMDLDPAASWLLRCDRVDFERGAIAPRHGHRGGGIRCLLRGRLEVTVGDAPMRAMRAGDAWFESGRDPVLAVAATDEDTSFIRVAVLPAEIRGQSSIVYVDPAEATRSRPRTYTVFVDEPISL
jgi:quercetin dioxygenase-like cupin family protein